MNLPAARFKVILTGPITHITLPVTPVPKDALWALMMDCGIKEGHVRVMFHTSLVENPKPGMNIMVIGRHDPEADGLVAWRIHNLDQANKYAIELEPEIGELFRRSILLDTAVKDFNGRDDMASFLKADLAEIEARGAKATPPPWRAGAGTVVSDAPIKGGVSGTGDVEYYGGFLIGETIQKSNAEWIANARQDMERLCRAVRFLAKEAGY